MGNDPNREQPAVLDEDEAVRRQLDEDMIRIGRLFDEDKGYAERLLDEAGIAKDDYLRQFLLTESPPYTPEQLEGLQRSFIQEAFRSLDPEAQSIIRLYASYNQKVWK